MGEVVTIKKEVSLGLPGAGQDQETEVGNEHKDVF